MLFGGKLIDHEFKSLNGFKDILFIDYMTESEVAFFFKSKDLSFADVDFVVMVDLDP